MRRASATIPLTIFPLLLFLHGAPLAEGRVETDGTVGERVDLAGPDFLIPATLGTRVGDNLLFSFERFGIEAGESANFRPTGLDPTIPVDLLVARGDGGRDAPDLRAAHGETSR